MPYKRAVTGHAEDSGEQVGGEIETNISEPSVGIRVDDCIFGGDGLPLWVFALTGAQ